jgi:hypothetical protein
VTPQVYTRLRCCPHVGAFAHAGPCTDLYRPQATLPPNGAANARNFRSSRGIALNGRAMLVHSTKQVEDLIQAV